MTLLDYFTPYNQVALGENNNDAMWGQVACCLLPDQPGPFRTSWWKQERGNLYVINRDQMTTGNFHYCHQCGSDPEIIEETQEG